MVTYVLKQIHQSTAWATVSNTLVVLNSCICFKAYSSVYCLGHGIYHFGLVVLKGCICHKAYSSVVYCIDPPARLAVYIHFTGWTSGQNFLQILFQRLAAGEWFTARVSSCGLFHIAYPSAPEMSKTELRSIYSLLCQDDMPMVRRSAASNLGKFAATVEYAHLKADTMSIFEDLTKDGNWIHISHPF